ncbi:Aminomethyltransferase folate-binding domain-containing protein [Hesseltinella vesiculosa]|uniref:Aminomethyltransferase folate-binding domain-containing protein n=1 Tax=Hesseltinella vesiculosa TaxID=101127 RepID=A0A1X2GXJ2_9FUNG|nr:Aminomethyltransferase folate-binding domain-containing protein [Hesseltinella vesiculosa]
MSVPTDLTETDPLHQGHHYAKIPHRQLMVMEGPDTIKFLQGLVTNNMPNIAAGGDGLYTGCLTPQGRMLYDVFVYPINAGENFPHPRFILDYGSSDAADLFKHLKRYLLRSKVKMRPATEEYDLYHIWSKPAPSSSSHFQVPVGGLIKKDNRLTDIGCLDPRVPGFGYRAVLPKDKDIKTVVPSDFTELPSSEYTIRRILHGVPEGVDDIWPEQSLPLECNLDYMNGVDFRKGCYVGQELTIRTYHTGVVRKRIVPVQIYKEGDSVPEQLQVDRSSTMSFTSQLDIKPVDGASKRSLGKTGGSVHNIGLALMRLEQVQKCVQDGVAPLRVADTNMLVRPFLPSWWPVEKDDNDA